MNRFLITLSLVATLLPASQSIDARRPLDLCTLITEWQQFSGTTVRVRALVKEGAEQSALSDPSCRDGKPLVFVSPTAKVKGKKKKLRQILKNDLQAEVVLEGVFRGPELAAIDPNLPAFMQEKLKGSRLRYGHLGSFDMMIEVTKILEAKAKKDEQGMDFK
jgi:hypothetical protein